jgi:Type II secretion system (T2SS), protein E, N-terminal domain
MASRLSDRLLAAGLVPEETVRAAIARQAVYGGTLDTALLELEALDEATLWSALADATDLTVPDRSLCESPEKYAGPPGAAVNLDAAWSVRCRAVPVAQRDGALQILCAEPVARAELDDAAAALGIPFALYVAPEIWVAAVQQAVFDQPMAPRLVRLFARVVGAEPVRRWQKSYAPEPVAEPVAAIERLPPRPVPEAAPPPPTVPATLAGAPPPAVGPPSGAAAPLGAGGPPPPGDAAPARDGLAPPAGPAAAAPPRLDKAAVPALIERLEVAEDDAEAYQALVAIARQDFGPKAKRWTIWWESHQDEERVDWLFEGLSHKTPEIRAAAEQELRALTGEYFGYHFDLPRRDREAARARWRSWWTESQSRGSKPPR